MRLASMVLVPPGTGLQLTKSTKQPSTNETKQIVTGTLWTSLLAVLLGTLSAVQANGQIYETNGDGTIGHYDATTGGTIQAPLVSGLK
jgi:hypothetical protein